MTEIDKDSPEFKQAVADAIAAEVEGLKAKNAELIAKNKKLQAGATITPDDLAAVESDREEWKSKFLAAEKAAKKLTTDLEVATKKAADIDSAYSRSVADASVQLCRGEGFGEVIVALVGILAEEDEGAAFAIDGEPGEVGLGLTSQEAQGRQSNYKAGTDRRERHCHSSNV